MCLYLSILPSLAGRYRTPRGGSNAQMESPSRGTSQRSLNLNVPPTSTPAGILHTSGGSRAGKFTLSCSFLERVEVHGSLK